MADAGSSTEVIVLAYLKGQGFYRSLMALEDESNMCSDAYDGEMMFLRWLMYEGHWTDAEACLLPFENHNKISYSDLLFTVRRQRFLEIVEDPKLRPSLADLVVILKGMECLCPPPVFQSLCYLLTLQKVTDSPQFSSWSIHKGRYEAFHACLTLLQPAFNRPLFKPSSIPLPAPEFLSQSLTAAGVRLKPAAPKQQPFSLHQSIDNLKSPFLADHARVPHGFALPNEPVKAQPNEPSPMRSLLNTHANSPKRDNDHALVLPVPLSPSRFGVHDEGEVAASAQANTPRNQRQASSSHASPHHQSLPLLPPISGDDDGPPSSISAASSHATASATGTADGASLAAHHDDAPSARSSSPPSRSPSPHESPRDDASSPPRAQAWTVEFAAPAPGARPPKALTQRLAAAQQKADDTRKSSSSASLSSTSSKPSSNAPLRPEALRTRTASSPSRVIVASSGDTTKNMQLSGQPSSRPLSATRQRLEARAAGLADKVEGGRKQGGGISGTVASSSRQPPPHSVRFAESDRQGSAGVMSSPGRGSAVPGTPDRMTKHRGKQSGALAGYDDFVPDSLQEVSSVSDAQVIRCISWSPAPGGPYFALGTTGHALRLCGVDSSSRICVLKSVEELHSGSVYCIAWSSSGSVVATGSNDKLVKIVNIAERDRKITDFGSPISLSGHTGTVRAATFCESFRSGCLVSGGAGDNIVRMWDTETQACVGRLPALSDHVQALATFPHDPALLLSGCKNGSTVGWDLRSLKKAFEVPHPHAPNDVTCVAAHPSRAAAVVGYGNGDVALFDIRGQGSLLHVMPLHTDQCRSVEFSPNGAYVATAAFDCNVVIAEASTLEPTKQLHAHRDKVVQAHWHPILPLLLTCSVDRSLKLWSQPML